MAWESWWTGCIILNSNDTIDDITFERRPNEKPPFTLQDGSSLRFLSVVETAQIPLLIVVTSPWSISTSSPETNRWLSSILLGPSGGWWRTPKPHSPFGVLISLDSSTCFSHATGPQVTEVLFYASKEDRAFEVEQYDGYVPDIKVKAVGLSSDLLFNAQDAKPTSPISPSQADSAIAGVFLPLSMTSSTEIINEPPVRKRKSATDAFDEASERRRKARRKGGEGVAAAAAPKSDSQVPTLKHSRSTSNSQPVTLQSRPHSRSPSIASSRPPTAVMTKRSTLSRVESAAEEPMNLSLVDKNKDVVSRIVMAGMRLYGLSQSKNRRSRAAASAAVSDCVGGLETDHKTDEEYKLVYHQVFKGTCFAFRTRIDVESLHPSSDAIRDVADRLLAIFCNDSLASGLAPAGGKLTPGGRKAFGSQLHYNESPFQPVASHGHC